MGIGTRKFARALSKKLSPKTYCKLINIRNQLSGKKHQILPSDTVGLYNVIDSDDVLHICRRERHNRSQNGIAAGINKLATQYHLEHSGLDSGDTLIDCGANIGELGVWAKKRGINYIAIEPEEVEAKCVDLNAFGGAAQTHNMALWNETTELTFFSKPNSADSSVFEIDTPQLVRKVTAIRLDELLSHEHLKGKTVLKVEAEGAEPEVLAGSARLLPYISMIAIDCGYERGLQQLHTFVEVNAFLQDHHFTAKKANFKNRITILYEREK